MPQCALRVGKKCLTGRTAFTADLCKAVAAAGAEPGLVDCKSSGRTGSFAKCGHPSPRCHKPNLEWYQWREPAPAGPRRVALHFADTRTMSAVVGRLVPVEPHPCSPLATVVTSSATVPSALQCHGPRPRPSALEPWHSPACLACAHQGDGIPAPPPLPARPLHGTADALQEGRPCQPLHLAVVLGRTAAGAVKVKAPRHV